MRTSGRALTTLLTGVALLAALALPPAAAGTTQPAAATVTADASDSAPQGACTDVLVLSVLGSGETATNTKTAKTRDAFLTGVKDKRTTTVETLPYPAAAMSVLADDFRQLIDFGLPGASDWNYFKSVNQGVAALRTRLTKAHETCPDQKWALIGYSQGAMVISDVLPEFQNTALYAGVMLVANPSRSVHDQQPNIGTAMPGDGLNFWVPPAGLGYESVPPSLAGVTTDLCTTQDLVCDTAWLFANLSTPVTGAPWEPIVGIAALADHGSAVHTAYDDAALKALATPAIERALTFAVPGHPTVTVLACGPSGDVDSAVPVKPLSSTGASAQRRTVKPTILTGALAGADFTDHGFTREPYWLDLDDNGHLTGTLPAGDWELDTTVATGLEPARTVRLDVHVETDGACGGVTGYVTDYAGEPVEGVEVWLEKTATGWDGESDRRLAMNRTDHNGYYSIVGNYTGDYLLFFTDGPAAATWDELTQDGYDDLFDQYYSTSATTDSSSSPHQGTLVHVGAVSLERADQMLVPSGSDRVYVYDQATSTPINGLHVTWGSGRADAYSGADGWAFHAGGLKYTGCQSFFDFNHIYVERARVYDAWSGQQSVRMYRGHTISGTVTDENGKPVQGATVSYVREQSWDTAHPDVDWGGSALCYGGLGRSESDDMTTDANGRYRFTGLYGGVNPFYVRAQVKGVGMVATLTLPTARDGAKDITVNLAVKPLTSSIPTVSGAAQVGRTLTAQRGTWTTGTSFTYRWAVNGSVVSGVTGTTFKPRPSDVGKKITVRVTGTKDGYPPATRTSNPTTAVVKGTLVTARPTITGVVKVGSKLTARRGTWTTGTTFTYRWYANGKAISGATSTTYKPTKAVQGKTITVKVTGTKTGYVSVTRASKVTGAVR